jgi:lipopolysaccharide export system protein LptC
LYLREYTNDARSHERQKLTADVFITVPVLTLHKEKLQNWDSLLR